MAARQSRILEAGARAPEIKGLEAKRPVLVVFFKITCPVCQFTLPFLNRIPGVVGISQNSEEDTREFVDEFGIQFPVILDREEENFPASNAYQISSVPTMFRLDPGGKIGHAIEGWRKSEMEALGALRPGDNVPEWKAG